MIGLKFNKWTVLEEVKIPGQHCKHYRCQCDCGTISIIPGTTLRLQKSKQCRNCSFFRHGMSKTNTYRIWTGIIQRCTNPRWHLYKYYGARGISICEEWSKFEVFFRDMGERPDSYEIDRIDPSGNYTPSNCRWISKKDNLLNKKVKLDTMPGKRFGKWLVIKRADIVKKDKWYYECQCICGSNAILAGSDLRRGGTTQCKECKNIAHRGWRSRIK